MFDEENCNRCGVCLNKCPFMQLPIEEAKEEVSNMIETKNSNKIIYDCALCGYCDIICPTKCHPSTLRSEIKWKKFNEKGLPILAFMSEGNPYNAMLIWSETFTEDQKRDIEQYTNPPKSKEMFYVGCQIPYKFPYLAKTNLLEEFPKVGGIKYCCNIYTYSFLGEDEAKIQGLELLNKFEKIGVEKLIFLCPGCFRMFNTVYPSLVEGFDIECQNIHDYLLEKYHKGELDLKNKIDQRITFHDPCEWRHLDKKIYDSAREFLEILGTEIVEMKHSKEKSLCCGLPIQPSNRSLASKMTRKRMSEAKEIDVDGIVFSCFGCISTLSPSAAKKKIKPYYITELAQLAIGENISHHNIPETTVKYDNYFLNKIVENPKLFEEKYILKNGKVTRI